MIKKIGIIGLGQVGEATVRSLKGCASLVRRRTGLKIEIKAVCDIKSQKSRIAHRYRVPFTTDPWKLINDPEIDIIVELMGGVNPAKEFIIESLRKHKNVVTANKALLAAYGHELFSLAKKKKCTIGFEASVCGAIPLIKSISEGLVACEVKELFGILNGTTNYILYKMSKAKCDFSSALKEAKTKGFAEKKPSVDINGFDARNKLCILSYLCFGIWPKVNKVYAEGISSISLLDVLYAQELNYSIKLLAIAKKQGKFLDLRVHPTLVSNEHPISDVSFAYNAVFLDTAPAGELLFHGQGAGGEPTSSSVISDIVSIALHETESVRKEAKMIIKNIKDLKLRYYIRFMAQDAPGVLAKTAKILASLGISIASVTQKERKRGRFVPIVMLTHEAKEESIRKAIAKIDTLPVIKSPSQVLRIEDL